MNHILNWLKNNKTTMAGVFAAITVYLQYRGIIDTGTSVMIYGILSAFGLTVAKDNSKHSTSEQVIKADEKKQELADN